jgi:hypothetical protein
MCSCVALSNCEVWWLARHIETAQMGTLMKGVQEGDVDRVYGHQSGAIPVEAFDQEDRERVLELLLSQERVVTLLYSKVFPVAQQGGTGKGKHGAGVGMDDSILNDEDGGDERPSTTGGLPSGIPGAGGNSARPHTLPAGEESGGAM